MSVAAYHYAQNRENIGLAPILSRVMRKRALLAGFFCFEILIVTACKADVVSALSGC